MTKRCLTCGVPVRANSATGLCATHYHASRFPHAEPLYSGPPKVCGICSKELRSDNASGLCSTHYHEARHLTQIEKSLKDEIAETLKVDRAPCPYCAIRADIGCKHQAVAA